MCVLHIHVGGDKLSFDPLSRRIEMKASCIQRWAAWVSSQLIGQLSFEKVKWQNG